MTTYREFVKTHIKSCPGRSWPEKMKACAAMWRRQKGRGKGLHVGGKGLRLGGKCGASVFDNFRDAGRNLSAGPRVKIGDPKFARNFLKSAGGRVKHKHQPLSRKMHHKLFGARGLHI